MNTKVQWETANKYLEKSFQYPGMYLRPHIIERLRLWVYPSFEPCVSLTIGSEKSEHYLRRVVWDQRKMTLTDEPQTYCREVKIDKSVLEETTKGLSDLVLPPFIVSSLIGIDGVQYGVEFGDFLQPARLSWWSVPPTEWNELHKWHSKYIYKLNGLLPESTINIEKALTTKCR